MALYYVRLAMGDIDADSGEEAASMFLSALDCGFPLQFQVRSDDEKLEWIALTPRQVADALNKGKLR